MRSKLDTAELADTNGKITADFPVYVSSKALGKNIDDLHAGWAMNSQLEGVFKNMKTQTGAYIYRDEMMEGKLAGMPYKVSNQIPIDKNGKTDLFFGNWSDLLIGDRWDLRLTQPLMVHGLMSRASSTMRLRRTFLRPVQLCLMTLLYVTQRASCTARTLKYFKEDKHEKSII